MFDVGFSEIALIGLIGLVVIGPERLPALARTLGVYVGKMRRFVTDVRSDVERELNADDLRKTFSSEDGLGGIKDAVDAAREDYRDAISVIDDAHEELSEAGESFADIGKGVASDDLGNSDIAASKSAASVPVELAASEHSLEPAASGQPELDEATADQITVGQSEVDISQDDKLVPEREVAELAGVESASATTDDETLLNCDQAASDVNETSRA